LSALDIPGYAEMVEVIGNKIAKEYEKRIKLLFNEIDFWESING